MKYLIPFLLILASCKKKEQPEEKLSVLTLKEMSDLATVEYAITKVIKASDDKTWYKLGDRKILMSCEAFIKAGIDMSSIDKNNFLIDDKSITVRLPEPKIISVNLPPENIKVEYEETSLFRTHFTSQERDELTRQGEQQIKNSIETLGILQQAKVNTSAFVRNFLVQLGYENINIEFKNGTSNSLQ